VELVVVAYDALQGAIRKGGCTYKRKEGEGRPTIGMHLISY